MLWAAFNYITIAVGIRRQTILQFWIALTGIIGVYRMVATVYLYAVKLSLYCLTELLGRPEVYATKPNVIGRYRLVLGHCTQELRLDVEASNRSLYSLMVADEMRNGIHQCLEASADIAFGQILILMAEIVKLVKSYLFTGIGGHIEHLVSVITIEVG